VQQLAYIVEDYQTMVKKNDNTTKCYFLDCNMLVETVTNYINVQIDYTINKWLSRKKVFMAILLNKFRLIHITRCTLIINNTITIMYTIHITFISQISILIYISIGNGTSYMLDFRLCNINSCCMPSKLQKTHTRDLQSLVIWSTVAAVIK
jgi:hypothetical protein